MLEPHHPPGDHCTPDCKTHPEQCPTTTPRRAPPDRERSPWSFHEEEHEMTESEDVVNHPSHYTAYQGIEVIDLTEQMNFNRGNAVKYIARAGLKDEAKEVEDLQKARWYLDREIARLTKPGAIQIVQPTEHQGVQR